MVMLWLLIFLPWNFKKENGKDICVYMLLKNCPPFTTLFIHNMVHSYTPHRQCYKKTHVHAHNWAAIMGLTCCKLETLLQVLWQAVKTLMKCSIVLHFIRVCAVCLDKNNLQGQKKHQNLENSTCDPLMCTMGSPMLSVSICMEKSIRI